MSFFRRRRRGRVDLGRYEAPPPATPATDERLVDESRMIAHSAVRMALKNRIILDVLRDGRDFDLDRIHRFTRDQLSELAEEAEVSAMRAKMRREVLDQRRQEDLVDDTHDPLAGEKRRRDGILRGLAEALDHDSGDEAVVDELVQRARVDAWDDIATSMDRRLDSPSLDPRYRLEREDRIGAFVAFDLAALVADRGDPDEPARV